MRKLIILLFVQNIITSFDARTTAINKEFKMNRFMEILSCIYVCMNLMSLRKMGVERRFSEQFESQLHEN